MKRRLGWAVGVNVAVACLVMQGCKATRTVKGPDYGNEVKTVETQPTSPAQADDIKVSMETTPAPATAVKEETPVTVAPTTPVPVVESTAPAIAPAPEYTLYTVKSGDMLSKISRRYNIRQKAILDLNPGLQPNRLYAGRKIKLPGNVDVDAAPTVAKAAPAPAAAAASVKAPVAPKAAKYTGATKEYVVKNGDSLGKIAYSNGTNIRTLKEINGLKTDRVFIGQKLKIPAEKAAAKSAVPAKKDTNAKAAAPAKEAAAKDAKAKDAKVKAAAPEKKAVEAPAPAPAAPVPPAAETVAPAAPAAAEQPAASEQASAPAPAADAAQSGAVEWHTVKEGEDVVSIAISYGVSPSALMDANDLKSSEVKPGDRLKIPAKSAQ